MVKRKNAKSEYDPPLPPNMRRSGRLLKAAEATLRTLQNNLLVYPGYKYLGLNADMDRGPPINELDERAYQHDLNYISLKNQTGQEPKKAHSYADSIFLNDLYALRAKGFPDKIPLEAAIKIFELKRNMYQLGMLPYIAGDLPDGIAPARLDEMEIREGNYLLDNNPAEQMDMEAANELKIIGVAPCFVRITGDWVKVYPWS